MNSKLRILVAIANYGTSNAAYLTQLLEEYRSMRHDIHIVVLSNTPKTFHSDIEVIVGLPSPDPWSLPFAHRELFYRRRHLYDLYIYSEDDTLVTEKNIDAFVDASSVLKENEVVGFLRTESGSDGSLYYSSMNAHFHWVPGSVCRRGKYVFASFTNDHAACFMLTADQLKTVIESGNFVVAPHSEQYDMLVTAATDPYVRCGLTHLRCISHLNEFTLPHLPNKYVGKMGIPKFEVLLQIDSMMATEGENTDELLRTQTTIRLSRWSKSYYEEPRRELLACIPSSSHRILSFGAGSGRLEEVLTERGKDIVAVCLDSVIASTLRAKGLTTLSGSVETVFAKLAKVPLFDCLVMTDLLHLFPDPERVLQQCARTVKPGGVLIILTPHFDSWALKVRRMRDPKDYVGMDQYASSGLHAFGLRTLNLWLRHSGCKVKSVVPLLGPKANKITRRAFGALKRQLADGLIITAERQHVLPER